MGYSHLQRIMHIVILLLIFSYANSYSSEVLANMQRVVTGDDIVAEGAVVKKVVTIPKYEQDPFLEGPAADKNGNVYFTDQKNNRIYIWSVEEKLIQFMNNAQRSNGLYFSSDGKLISCADESNRLIAIDTNGNVEVLVDNYDGKLLNGPNDLWVDSKGGIYFTDPYYFRSYWTHRTNQQEQDGQCVYYLSSDRKSLVRVADGFVRPNGLVGTRDGKKIYVSDIGGKKTYSYLINDDGTLYDKKLFVEFSGSNPGCDGMTIDNRGNVYLCSSTIHVYDSNGVKIKEIQTPEKPTNVCFGGKDFKTLFITTASASFYSLQMNVSGIAQIQVGVRDEFNKMPGSFMLFQNYPNPFNPSTVIEYSIPAGTRYAQSLKVSLKVYDMLGQEIKTLVDEEQLPGLYKINFDGQQVSNGRQLPSGMYLAKLTGGNYSKTIKLLLMK